MSKQRMGKNVADIFSKREPITQEKIATPDQKKKEPKPIPQKEIDKETSIKSRGRPAQHTESWTKVTVVLLDRQIHWIDNLASEIRLNTRAALSRAEILRAMIDAVAESGIELSRVQSDVEVKDLLLKSLKQE